jgi:hypothetical protein
MFRETIVRNLRNLNRQRRSYKRYFDDMNILIGEANYTDDCIAKMKGVKQATFESSGCLTMAVNAYIDA